MPKTCPICATTYPDTSLFCPADGTTLRSDGSDTDLIGTVIADRYLISKLLGEGGMGRVYLADHIRLPQRAAIKVLHPSMVQDSGAVQRFNREASNAAKIEHDRVARVFDFGETKNGLVYLAMEFVPGQTLRSILEEQPRLSPARAANLIYQVAEGLDAAHRMSIVHRDLKPDNIMVITDEAGIDRAKVVDFGIAKAVDATSGQRTQLTQAGSVIGTPEFMSPEQVFGETLDARSDVYALALVGYQMLTGLLPFDSSTPERSLTARIVSDPRTLAEAAPEVQWPAALQEAFNRALAREPDARTGSALDFGDAVVAATEAWIGASVLRTRTPLSNPALLTAANATPLSSAAVPTVEMTPPSPAKPVAAATAPAPKPAAAPPAATPTAVVGDVVVAKSNTGASKGMLFGGIAVIAVAAAAIFMLKGSPSTGPADAPAVPTPPSTEGAPAATIGGSGAAKLSNGKGAQPGQGATDGNRSTASGTQSAATGAPAVPTNAVATPPAAAGPAEDTRQLFDSVKKALSAATDESDAVAARVGRDAVPVLQRLLTRQASASDSTWVYLNLVYAHLLSSDAARACLPYREAKRLAKSGQQLQAVADLSNSGALTCAP